MPQLQDLRAKIALDFPNVAAATAQAALLGQALQRELGGTRGTEIDRSMKQIGNAVEEAGVKVANAGTAYVKWGDTVKTSTLRISSDTARTKADFDELERRTKVLGATLESEFKKGSTAVVKLGADGTASLGNVSRAMTATAAGGAGLGGVFSAIGTAAAGAAVPALISLGGALSPVLALVGALVVALGAALVGLVAFGAGITAVTTVIGISLSGIIGLGAAIVALTVATQGWSAATQTVPQAQLAVGTAVNAHQAAVLALDKAQQAYNQTSTHTVAQNLALAQAHQAVAVTAAALTTAQDKLTAAQTGASNPLQTLKTSLGEMANALGTQAAPMAAIFLGYLNSLVPAIGVMGSQLLTWFGSRIPDIMTSAGAAIDSVLVTIGELGAIWGQVIDYFILGQTRLLPVFGALLDFGVGAVQGLVTNLLNLSDWFLDRLPLFQPVISTVFGLLGTTVQVIIQGFGRLVDWVLQNWPQIVSSVQTLWDTIVQGWNVVRPLLGDFMVGWQAMAPLFDYIRTHAENLKPILVLLGIELGVLAFASLGVVAAAVLVVAALEGIFSVVTTLVNGIKAQIPEAGAQFDALGREARREQDIIGSAFSGIGSAMHQLVINIQLETSAAGRQFDALGRAGRQMQIDIGNVFSAIGSGAHGMASAVGSAFSSLGRSMHHGLIDVAGIYDAFANVVNNALAPFNVHLPHIDTSGLPPPSPIYVAQGGVIPGYAPGQDTVPAMLSPGEGVLTPQTVRGLGGSGAIDLLNRAGSGIHGLGALVANDVGALGSLVGSIAGQCITKNTPISTESGQKPIEDVRAGDRVWTRQGLRAVTWAGLTRRQAKVLEIVSGDRRIVLTHDHLVWVVSKCGSQSGSIAKVPGNGGSRQIRPSTQLNQRDVGSFTGKHQQSFVVDRELHPRLAGADLSPLSVNARTADSTTVLLNDEVVSGVRVTNRAVGSVSIARLHGHGEIENLSRVLAASTMQVRPEQSEELSTFSYPAEPPTPNRLRSVADIRFRTERTALDDSQETVEDITVGGRQTQADTSPAATIVNADVALALKEAGCPAEVDGGTVSHNMKYTSGWYEARDLRPGDWVLQMTEPGRFKTTPIELISEAPETDTYDLTVSEAHEFCANGMIVHNCVVAVEKWTGHFFPVAMASQMTRWINSATAAAGEIFVSTLPPFGHTGIVLPGGMVIDSNWGLDERVRIHPLRDIPSIAGYIAGIPTDLGSLAGLALPSLGDILKTLLSPLTSAAHSAAGLIPEVWVRPLANSLIDRLASNIEGRQFGGPVIPGHLYAVGESGPELFSPGVPGTIIPAGTSGTGRVEALLAEAVRILGHIDGTPPASRRSAQLYYGT